MGLSLDTIVRFFLYLWHSWPILAIKSSSECDIWTESSCAVAFLSAGLLTSLGRQCRNYIRPYFLDPSLLNGKAKSAPTFSNSAATSATNSSAAQAEAPNSLPKYPYPNKYKRLYDIIGWVVVQVNLNYIACSFILLNWTKCITAYHRMGWYTHVVIVGAMAFFHFGGRRALRRGLPANAAGKGKGKGIGKGGAGAGVGGEKVEGGAPTISVEGPSEIGKQEDVSTGSSTAIDRSTALSSTFKASPSRSNPSRGNDGQEEDETDHKDFKWVKHALKRHEKEQGTGDAAGLGGEWGFVDGVMKGAETPAVEMGTPRWSREGSPDRS